MTIFTVQSEAACSIATGWGEHCGERMIQFITEYQVSSQHTYGRVGVRTHYNHLVKLSFSTLIDESFGIKTSDTGPLSEAVFRPMIWRDLSFPQLPPERLKDSKHALLLGALKDLVLKHFKTKIVRQKFGRHSLLSLRRNCPCSQRQPR